MSRYSLSRSPHEEDFRFYSTGTFSQSKRRSGAYDVFYRGTHLGLLKRTDRGWWVGRLLKSAGFSPTFHTRLGVAEWMLEQRPELIVDISRRRAGKKSPKSSADT